MPPLPDDATAASRPSLLSLPRPSSLLPTTTTNSSTVTPTSSASASTSTNADSNTTTIHSTAPFPNPLPSNRLLSTFPSPHERIALMHNLKPTETMHMRRRLAQLRGPDPVLLSADPLVCEELWRMRRDGEVEALEGSFSEEDERRAWSGVYGGVVVKGEVGVNGVKGGLESRERKERWDIQGEEVLRAGVWCSEVGYEANQNGEEDGRLSLWYGEVKGRAWQSDPWLKEVLQSGEEHLASRLRPHFDALNE